MFDGVGFRMDDSFQDAFEMQKSHLLCNKL